MRLADSVESLEDAAVDFLIVIALRSGARQRSRLEAACQTASNAGLAIPWAAWSRFSMPVVPNPVLLPITGAEALAINL